MWHHPGMKRLVLAGLLGVLAAGCSSGGDSASQADAGMDPKNAMQDGQPSPTGPNSGGPAPMAGMGAGGMTPMSGTDSVQGGGSAAGQVAKDRAREVAGSSPSSINQMGGEDGN